MHALNQDDAFGPTEDYTDQQGVFATPGSVGAKPAIEPGRSGGGFARVMLFAVPIVLLLCLGWVGWKFATRTSDAADTLSLPAEMAPEAEPPMSTGPLEAPPVQDAQVSSPAPVDDATTPDGSADMPVVPAADHVSPVTAALEMAGGTEASGGMAATSPGADTDAAAPSDATDRDAHERDASLLLAMQQRLSDLETSVAAIKTQVATLAAQRSRVAPAAPARAAARPLVRAAVTSSRAAASPTGVAAISAEGVVLKAVLEGRAWLQLKTGETVTVAEGDSVPGMGPVQSIDVERGLVQFVSGAVLR